MPLPAQPLEVSDFSGGITDNYVQGGPSRAQTIQNFFITSDKKLEERYGFSLFMSGQLSALEQRVNNLYLFDNESILLAQTARQIYVYENSTFTAISGVGGHEPVEGGDQYSQNSYAEFQKQLYITNDESYPGTQPSKIYKDSTGAWTAKTAGLPRAYVSGNYTTASLLAKCIKLANAIRTSMISHYNDAINTTVWNGSGTPYSSLIAIHRFIDKNALSYLSTQTFSASAAIDPIVPNPVPTAAPAATTEATLYTLVSALIKSYNAHLDDINFKIGSWQMLTGSSTPAYHMKIYPGMFLDVPVSGALTDWPTTPHGPNLPLSSIITPTTPSEAAAILDDILLKWNMHRKSMWTHSPVNDPVQFNKYIPLETAVGEIHLAKYTPLVTPDYSELYKYVNNIKRMYEAHTGIISTYMAYNLQHSMRPNVTFGCDYTCYLPDCTDLESMYTLIYWLRNLYYLHYEDSANMTAKTPTTAITFTAATSANITAVTKTSTADATFVLPSYTRVTLRNLIAGQYYFSPSAYGIGRALTGTQAYGSRVQSSGAGTATMDHATSGAGTYVGTNSYTLFHTAVNPDAAYTSSPFIDASSSLAGDSESLITVENYVGRKLPTQDGENVAGWLGLADELFYALINHATNKSTHFISNSTVSPYYTKSYTAPLFMYYTSLITTFLNPFFIPKVSQVSYAFHWSDTYTVETGGIEYVTRGNPVISDPIYIGATNPVGSVIASEDTTIYPDVISIYAATNVISGIPALVNNGQSNYDTSVVKMNISRTTDGGTVYYLLDSIANAVTTYSDKTSDTLGAKILTDGTPLYTNGGVIGYDQPPLAKFIHNLNGTVYYGAITDTSQFFPQRIRQSVQYAPDAAPATFYVDLDDNLTGLSSTRANLMAFCTSSVYRINGGFNNLGQGALTFERLSDTIGGINQKSIVQTDVGVFFAGGDGFYYTDGYQIIKISLELDQTYKNLTKSEAQKRSVYGTYDRLNRRIWWGMREESSGFGNTVAYVYYLNFGIKPSGVFTTVNAEASNFRPAALLFRNNNLLYGSERGNILTIDGTKKQDLDLDFLISSAENTNYYINYNYTSCAFDSGSTFQRKWFTKLHLIGKNIGNSSIQPYVISDLNATGNGIRAMTIMNYQENIKWASPTHVWGDATKIWGAKGKFDMWRRFPSGSLRNDFLQIKFVPARVTRYASSTFGLTCTHNGTGGLTLDTTNYPGAIWPLDIAYTSIYFAYDNYTTGWNIYTLSGSTIYIAAGAAGVVPTGSGLEWQINSKNGETRSSITSYVLHYNLLGDENEAYPGAKSDSGAGNLGENP